MGLDVHLYRYDDFAACEANEEASEQFSEATWERVSAGATYEALTEAQKEEARTAVKAYNVAHGLNEWGTDETNKHEVEIPSAKYPEHMFKIGYFRSSYNSGGFDSVAENLIGMRLDEVFSVDDEYHVRPDWNAAREKATDLLTKMNEAPKFRVMTVAAEELFGSQPTYDAADAIRLVREAAGKRSAFDDGWYSNRDGHFGLKSPLSIVAAIPGRDILRKPCVHLVYAADLDWYIQAAEIVLETIDYVLAQPDAEQYVLHWST